MSLTQSVAPSVEPVTTAAQKTWMRVDSSDEDTLIGSLASRSSIHRDGYEPAVHYSNLGTQDRQLPGWRYCAANLPITNDHVDQVLRQ